MHIAADFQPMLTRQISSRSVYPIAIEGKGWTPLKKLRHFQLSTSCVLWRHLATYKTRQTRLHYYKTFPNQSCPNHLWIQTLWWQSRQLVITIFSSLPFRVTEKKIDLFRVLICPTHALMGSSEIREIERCFEMSRPPTYSRSRRSSKVDRPTSIKTTRSILSVKLALLISISTYCSLKALVKITLQCALSGSARLKSHTIA